MKITRRQFFKDVAGAALLAPMAGRPLRFAQASPAGSLPSPDKSGIEHIVVVMMENRSFDHFLGWLPNADGIQKGLEYVDSEGAAHSTRLWSPDYTGCGYSDPDHSYEGGRIQYNGGAMDGFLRSGRNDEYAIGYYGESDRPFLNALVRNYTTLDRYFCSILGPTFPNRLFLHSAQTDRLANTASLTRMPTIWDRLARAGVMARYYYSNVPFLGLWGLRYLLISRRYDQFLADAANGRLPAVSILDPSFTSGDNVSSNDDHPFADIRRGDAFLSEAFHAVATGPAWPNTVFIVVYDEWGGFFDHVAPPRAAAPNDVDPDLENGKALLGFRIPAVVASPFSRGNAGDPRVNSLVFDHTSVLKLIEWRWGLTPLTARDASDDIENLAFALDFANPQPEVPDFPRPVAPPPDPCATAKRGGTQDLTEDANSWDGLRRSGLLDGWPLP